jgi:hypothetical protein
MIYRSEILSTLLSPRVQDVFQDLMHWMERGNNLLLGKLGLMIHGLYAQVSGAREESDNVSGAKSVVHN